MSLIDDLEADAKTVLAAIANVFTSVKAKLVSFLTKGASAVATSIAKQLPQAEADIEGFVEQAAMDAVSAAEAAGGSGTAKMAAALASLASSLTTKGITLAENELRLLIENALLAFKAAQASSGSGTSAPPAPAAA